MKNIELKRLIFKAIIRIIPQAFAIIIFIMGLVLLISIFKPIAGQQLKVIQNFIPLELLEISHIGSSIIAIFMLFVARGLWERLDSAYYMALGLFVAGGLFLSIRTLDLVESLILILCAFLILPCKPAFNRKSKLMELDPNPKWLGIIIISLFVIFYIGFYIYEKIPYEHQLWSRFNYDDSVSRFLRGILIASITFVIIILWRLFGLARVKPQLPDSEEIEKLKAIVPEANDSQAWLALLGDKYIFWNKTHQAFLMYGIYRKHWIVMGEPVGPAEEIKNLCWEFKELAKLNKAKPVFYSVTVRMLPLMIDLGFGLYKIGEEAKVNAQEFTLVGGQAYGFRQVLKRFERLGASFEILPQEEIENTLPILKSISDDWLNIKNGKEKSFSLGYFDEEYLKFSPITVVKIEGKIEAFVNLMPTNNKETLCVDLMRYSSNAPKEIMEYIFIKLILYAQENGYKYFSLGLSALGGLDAHDASPLWAKIGNIIYKFGSEFYNFEGLRAYKNKFHPEWHPRYMAVAGKEVSLVNALMAFVNLSSNETLSLENLPKPNFKRNKQKL